MQKSIRLVTGLYLKFALLTVVVGLLLRIVLPTLYLYLINLMKSP